MSRNKKLTRSQERRRIDGLRLLARIIARHYLAHPELYPGPGADGAVSTANDGHRAADGKAGGKEKEGGHGRKPATKRVMLKTEAAWELLRQRNWSQNDLAREAGLSRGYVSQLFNRKRSPAPWARRQLQQALGVTDFDALFVVETVDD